MNEETKPKNPFAVALGKLNKGIPRRFSPEELAKRTQRLRDYAESKKQETAWKLQAKDAISQNQGLEMFVLHCHPDNREIARKAYIAVRKEQGFIGNPGAKPN